MTDTYGYIKFNTRVQHGRNKRNVPLYEFVSNKSVTKDEKILIGSKNNYQNIDQYAILNSANSLNELIGPVNSYEATKRFIFKSNNIKKNKENYDVNYCGFYKEHLSDFMFTIDDESTTDYDDAFSFDFATNCLYIFITDLTSIKIDNIYNLLNIGYSFYDSDPNFTYHLFNEDIKNNFSLIAGEKRNTFCLEINLVSKNIKFHRKSIIVSENLTYDKVNKLLDCDEKWNIFKSKFEEYFGKINDSHELVEKMMICYNSMFHLNLIGKLHPIRAHVGYKLGKSDIEKLAFIDNNLVKKLGYHSAEYCLSTNLNNYHFGLSIYNYMHTTSPLRRVMDFIIQKIAFNNETFNLNEICTKCNQKLIENKKAYNEIKLLNLLYDLKESEEREFKAIIIKLDIRYLTIYISDLDIFHNITLVPKKLENLIETKIDSNCLKISHVRDTKNIVCFEKFQYINVKTMIKTSEQYLHKKIKFYITDQNVINIFN